MSDARLFLARWAALIAGWCVAFAAALCVDAPVARWVRESGTAAAVKGRWWADDVLKAPGAFWFTAAVVGGLWLARRIDWRQVLFALAAAAVAGLNVVVKWVVGRTRPFKLPGVAIADQPQPLTLHPFWHGLRGLFDQRDLSFPSGHECTAFALAAAVAVVWRPGMWPLLACAAAVGVERVLEDAHYVSDVVGAAGFAGAGTALAWAALGGWIRPRSGVGFPVLLADGSL